MHVLAPGADACQSQRLVTTAWKCAVEIIQQLTGNPWHSNVLISVLHCRVFQLLKQACMQRGLLPKKHMVSHVQSTNSLNHSHSLLLAGNLIMLKQPVQQNMHTAQSVPACCDCMSAGGSRLTVILHCYSNLRQFLCLHVVACHVTKQAQLCLQL